MNALSLKKLGLSYFALLTLCFTGLASEVQGNSSVFDSVERTLKLSSCSSDSSSSSESSESHHHHHHFHSKPINDRDLLLRTSAVQQGIDTISKFALRFSAAVRAFPNNDAELEALLDTLTRHFYVEIVIPGADFIVTNPDELRNLIDSFGAQVQFDSSLTSNVSLESYHKSRNGRRTMQFQALEYVVQTPNQAPGPVLPSILIAALDQYHIEETKPDVFKVKKLVATTIENGVILLGPQ